MRIAAAQIAPVFLDREGTLTKIENTCREAARKGVQLLAFPEAFLPGYPTWLSRTNGAAFEDPLQKELYARYLDQSVELPGPELERLQALAAELDLYLVVGVMERGSETARGTLWASALSIHPTGEWLSHRKLVPTYEERLVWGHGDGHGLRVREVHGWRVGALNCWENWMPAARMALYAGGEELHVSIWPGSAGLTGDISRFTAREGRVFVLAASGVLRVSDLPADLPARTEIVASAPEGILHSGGSRILSPTGEELASLDTPEEGLVIADIDHSVLAAERQNLDPSGHYHRKDVFEFEVDRRRKGAASFRDD